MKRRRSPGGGLFGGAPRPLRSVPSMLLQAHRLFSWRQYIPAADLYLRLAEGALVREPSRAPQLFLQAGRAMIAGGKFEQGLELLQRGLNLLYQQQRYLELYRIGWRVIQGLENNNLDDQAKTIKNWLSSLVQTEAVAEWGAEPVTREMKARLPLSCPSCGGVVDPSEVEWVDEVTVQCSYCGSMLRGEES